MTKLSDEWISSASYQIMVCFVYAEQVQKVD